MKIPRYFTTVGKSPYDGIEFEARRSEIRNPDGSTVFLKEAVMVPTAWSQVATDILAQKYFRRAGVTQSDGSDGGESDSRQVFHRLAGCWRHWGELHGYFETKDDGQAFYDELCHMLAKQVAAPNSPQWFNTGLHFAYGIAGAAARALLCRPRPVAVRTAEVDQMPTKGGRSSHACFTFLSVNDDLVNEGGIMDLWTREARIFKYGSGVGTNFSKIRGESEKLSGGGKSSGLMSFLRVARSQCAGAIKSGGTTRRAAKMVCLDLDHPDIETFVNWKVTEEQKVAALVTGSTTNNLRLNAVMRRRATGGTLAEEKSDPTAATLRGPAPGHRARLEPMPVIPLNYIQRGAVQSGRARATRASSFRCTTPATNPKHILQLAGKTLTIPCVFRTSSSPQLSGATSGI